MFQIATLQELAIDPTKPVFVDTETGGSRKVTKEIRGKTVTRVEEYTSVVTVQVFQEHRDKVQVFIISELPSYALDYIFGEISKTTMVGHNFTYDLHQFKKHCDNFTRDVDFFDTFYASRVVFPQWQKYTLDKCLTRVLGYDPYAKEGLVKPDMQKSFDPEQHPTHAQLVYASVDVFLLPKLYHKVKQATNSWVYRMDVATVKNILRDEKGMPVDLDKLYEMQAKDQSTVVSAAEVLEGINVNSYMQVRKALGTAISSDEVALQIIRHRENGLRGWWFRVKMGPRGWAVGLKNALDEGRIRVEVREFGKRKPITSSAQLPTSSKTLVYAMESSYEHSEHKILIAEKIIETRKALKRLNFVERAERFMEYDDSCNTYRIKATYSAHAINGRIQQDDENLTQYPRAMKCMWGHKPGNGRKLIYCDFAQVELRIICAALPEMSMYKALKDGKDLHSFVAESFNFSEEEIAKLPAGQNPRQIAKQCNFLLLYGGGNANFQKVVCKTSGVWFDDDMVAKIVSRWKEIFPGIQEWHARNSKSTDKRDKTVMGREYKADTVTDLNNIKVSGTGSEIFKLWLHYIDKELLDAYDDIYIVNRVHDSVTLDVPDNPEMYVEVAQKLARLAQKAWFAITAHASLTDVPMPTDVGVGSNMCDIEYGEPDFSFKLEPYEMMEA